MSMAELYSMMMEQESERLAEDRQARQAHRIARAPTPREIAQDAKIRRLERDNENLKMLINGLVQTLVHKGLMNGDDVHEMISRTRSGGAMDLDPAEAPITTHA